MAILGTCSALQSCRAFLSNWLCSCKTFPHRPPHIGRNRTSLHSRRRSGFASFVDCLAQGKLHGLLMLQCIALNHAPTTMWVTYLGLLLQAPSCGSLLRSIPSETRKVSEKFSCPVLAATRQFGRSINLWSKLRLHWWWLSTMPIAFPSRICEIS
ncbi:hypothetical protein D9M69_468530 [compost metagenome]